MSKKTNLLEVRDLSIHYSGNTILKDVSLDVRKNEIFGIIGPSGSGKTSFLKAVNRMDELTSGMSTTGSIRFQGYDTSAWKNLFSLRKKMGVVFPLPVGLPLSIYENVAFAPRIAGTRNKTDLDRIVERVFETCRALGRSKRSARFTRIASFRRTATASHDCPSVVAGTRSTHAR